MPPSVVLAGEGDAPVWSKDNDHPHTLMLLGDLLPSLSIHIAINHGLGDREPLQLLQQLRL